LNFAGRFALVKTARNVKGWFIYHQAARIRGTSIAGVTVSLDQMNTFFHTRITAEIQGVLFCRNPYTYPVTADLLKCEQLDSIVIHFKNVISNLGHHLQFQE
jgi:hypothetical protein